MTGGWELIVLGIAQDGGVPHPGCDCETCTATREGALPRERVACLGLRHAQLGLSYLFDATPDLPDQLHALGAGRAPDGIFLTHAHIGHYPGLIYLGPEALGARDVPVHATAPMQAFLSDNDPWRQLIQSGHMRLEPLVPDQAVLLPGGLSVTPLLVPHRDELSDTVGFRISGPRASALFIPDIDGWDLWDRDLGEQAGAVELLFLDGTFSSTDELPDRDPAQVRHPLMPDTRARLTGCDAALWFIHLNHTNPALWQADDVARQGMTFAI